MAIYSLFGLRVSSELALPEVPSGRGPVEVVIRFGDVPDELAGAEVVGGYYQAAPGCLLLAIPGVARFLVSRGEQILVEPVPEAEESEVRIFLLGSAMGALLQQRGYLPLHASAIEREGRAVLFAGDSGLGKSTLAAAFHGAGRRVLADDVTAVRVDEAGVPVAYPAYPELRLWADAVDKLGLAAEELPRLRPELDKSRLPIGDGTRLPALPIRDLYLLATGDEDELAVEPIEGMGKLEALTRNTYRGHFLAGQQGKERHFRLCVALARHARVARLVRPSAGFRLTELVELVERDLASRAA